MINKEKQIEEMARINCQLVKYTKVSCKECTLNKPCNWFEEAETLYNAGYTQKVKDGEIVLSISEVEEFRKDQAEVKFLKKQIQEQTRKETAREFLSWVREVAITASYNVDDNPRMESFILLSDMYNFVKEKFDIEVE